MSYTDDLNYQTLLLIQAAHGDEKAGAAAYEAAWDSGVDPIHIAQHMASILRPMMPLEKVEEMLAVAAAASAAGFPESPEGPPYESPRGRIRRRKD